jgi:hypothetical protein
LAMKVLVKNLEKLSGQAGDNARERLYLPDIGAYRRIGGPVHQARANVTPGEEIENGYIKKNDEGSRYQRIR